MTVLHVVQQQRLSIYLGTSLYQRLLKHMLMIYWFYKAIIALSKLKEFIQNEPCLLYPHDIDIEGKMF